MIKSVSIVLHRSQNLKKSENNVLYFLFQVILSAPFSKEIAIIITSGFLSHLQLKVYLSFPYLPTTFLCFFRLLVRQSGKLLHIVSRLHFVDSPEWFGVVADDLFQVTIIWKSFLNKEISVIWMEYSYNDSIGP